MRLLSAGLIYVAVSTVAALLLGENAGGLNLSVSFVSLIIGATGAIAAFFLMAPSGEGSVAAKDEDSLAKYRSIWLCLIGFVFAIFALRSFCWLFFFNGEDIDIQSPFNLGDLGLHLTYIKTFASGMSIWPDSPIFVYSKLRYPAGIDLFNGILTNLGFDLRPQLAATGLLAALATFYALYRWGGTFTVAGFLFNGGIAGYAFLETHQFLDYQGTSHVSWKSIPLTMFVTQRGLLYAIPAGLLLLWQWRAKYGPDSAPEKQLLPVWVEYILYATMPLFHVHTFIALSIVLLVLFLTRPAAGPSLLKLVAAAVLPAVLFIWLTTDKMRAGSILQWHLGWTQNVGDLKMPFFWFWFFNFGVFLPLAIALIWTVARQESNELIARQSSGLELQQPGFGLIDSMVGRIRNFRLSIDAAYLAAAVLIFLLTISVKTAPWEWDNIKLLIWAYFITLPILWNRLLARWPLPTRAAACFLLFFSGFVSLIGGLAAGRPGYQLASRAEIDFVATAVRRLPIEARFAGFPTYNHSLLLNGRKMVCGYAGHLWTQGINSTEVENKLHDLMLGQGDWRKIARELEARYLFWGNLEKTNYSNSSRPWEKQLPLVAQGSWGSIYDFGPTTSR
jgi:hypothetical protein